MQTENVDVIETPPAPPKRRLSFSIAPETKAKVLRYLGFSVLSFVSYLLFVYLTFPWDRLLRLVLRQAESRGGVTVDIQGFSPSLGTGVVADEVRIKTKPALGEKEGSEYVLQDVSARISLLSLLVGNYSVSFGGQMMGGEIEGNVWVGGNEEKDLELSVNKLDVSKISLLAEYVGVPVFGSLNAEISLKLPAAGIRSASGRLQLSVENGKIGEKGAKFNTSGSRAVKGYDQSVTLQEGASLGVMVAEVSVDKGRGKIQKFSASGGELEASLENGSLQLKQQPFTSVLSGLLKFRFDEAYVDRNGMKLFLTAPTLTQAKMEDGFFAFSINDPLNRLKFRPSRRELKKAPSGDLARPPVRSAFDSIAPAPTPAPSMDTPVLTPDEMKGTINPEKMEAKEPEKIEGKEPEKAPDGTVVEETEKTPPGIQ